MSKAWEYLTLELLMYGGGGRSILPLLARCLGTINVCIWRKLVFVSVVVTMRGGVCGNVCCVSAVVKDSVFLALEC